MPEMDSSRGYSKCDPSRPDSQKRRGRHDYPQTDSLDKRPHAYAAQGILRQAGTNQEENDCEANTAKAAKRGIHGCAERKICIRNGGRAEEKNEPGPMNARSALGNVRGNHRD